MTAILRVFIFGRHTIEEMLCLQGIVLGSTWSLALYDVKIVVASFLPWNVRGSPLCN